MKLTTEDFEKMPMKELNEFVNKWFLQTSKDRIWDKLNEKYCSEKKNEYNYYATCYADAINSDDKDREEKMRKYRKAVGRVLSTVSEDLENYNKYLKLSNELDEEENKIKGKEGYKKWRELRKNIFEKMDDICSKGISPDEIDDMIKKIEHVKGNMAKELGKINEFNDIEKDVREKVENLKNNKSVMKSLCDEYESKFKDISENFYSSVIDNDVQADSSIKQMEKLGYSLRYLANNSNNEFKSLEELKKEKLEENETKESKVKNYIKAKIGNARYLEAEVVKYSEWYKGKNEFIPLGEMREIYGTKGALMMICRLEDGSVKNKKRFSAYRRFCKKILENYRSLKVEAAIAALEGDEISASSFKEEDAKELNSMLHELNNLMGKDTSKFPLANPKDKKFNLSKFFLSTKSQIAKLKNTKGEKNKKHKELIDKVIKEIRKIESQSPSDSFNIDASMEREEYIKKYDNFVSESAELAVTYLKTEGKIKIQRFASQGKKKVLFEFKIFNKERDLAMDACKVALMCLVAVCSKDKKHITEGKKYFRNVKKYLNKYIG